MRCLAASLLLVCALTAVPSLAQGSASGNDPSAQVDEIFSRWNKPTSPGCALAVFKDGQIIYRRGYGMADLDHDVPIRPDTVFHVASMSKQFAAASILLLAQEGKLSLDDDVRKYVPESPNFGVPITLRHLIHHTSGMRDQWDLLILAGWRYSLDLITDEDVLSVFSQQRDLNFPPGSRYMYSNTGYTLLAQVVKRVSGKSFREFTEERIFQPLGMKSTHFRDDHAEIVKKIAYGYETGKGGAFKLSVTQFDTVGATSLLTTVEDMALWDENFYHPRVGGPDFTAQMLERFRLSNGEQIDYAMGLVVGKYRGLSTVDHAGSDAGYRSDMIRFPDQHFTVACLCNAAEAHPDQLTRKVADIYLAPMLAPPDPAPSAEAGVQIPESKLQEKVGLYWSADGDETIRLIVHEGKLCVAGRDDQLELVRIAEDRFRPPDSNRVFSFGIRQLQGTRTLTVGSPGGKPRNFEAVKPWDPGAYKLAAFAGSYRSEEIEPIYRIQVKSGKLVLHRLKFKDDPLDPVLHDLFTGDTGSLRFTRTKQGRISGFLLNNGRIRNFRFRKQP